MSKNWNIGDLVKQNYKPLQSVPSGKLKKGAFKGQAAAHRVVTKWGMSKGLDLTGVVQPDTEVISLDDPVAAIQASMLNKHLGIKNSTVLLSSDPSNMQYSNIIPNILQMQDEDDIITINGYNPSMKKFVYVGNNAFSITDEVLTGIIDRKPSMVRLVTEANNFNGMSEGHKSRNKIFNGLKDIGLHRVFYLKNMLFEQYAPDGVSKEKAQVSALVFQTELGYQDNIEVYGPDDTLRYTADRKIATFLPRSKQSYEAGHMPKINQHFTVGLDWANRLDGQGIKKTNLTQDPTIMQRQEVKDLIMDSEYRIQIPVMNNGTPGNNTFWDEFNVGYHLAYAKALDPQVLPDYQTFVLGFGSDKQARDSILSLFQTREFQEIYQAASTSKNLSNPVLKHFLMRFPADRTWTSQEVNDYVAANKRD